MAGFRWLALVLVLLSAPALAQAPLRGDERQAMAAMMLENAQAMAAVVPAMAESDRAAIQAARDKALAENDRKTFMALRQSPDYVVWTARGLLDPLLAALKPLSGGDYATLPAEMDLWAEAVRQIGNTDLYWGLDWLARKGVVAERVTFDGVEPQTRFWDYLTTIQDSVILPYIQGRLPNPNYS